MKSNENNNLKNEEAEAKFNLTGFFKLLLEIDMRNNPHLYENNENPDNTD
jgi:hypothetical protein